MLLVHNNQVAENSVRNHTNKWTYWSPARQLGSQVFSISATQTHKYQRSSTSQVQNVSCSRNYSLANCQVCQNFTFFSMLHPPSSYTANVNRKLNFKGREVFFFRFLNGKASKVDFAQRFLIQNQNNLPWYLQRNWNFCMWKVCQSLYAMTKLFSAWIIYWYNKYCMGKHSNKLSFDVVVISTNRWWCRINRESPHFAA